MLELLAMATFDWTEIITPAKYYIPSKPYALNNSNCFLVRIKQ